MAVSKDSGIATRTSDGDNSNLRQTFVVSFYHALFSGRGTTTHIGNTNIWMFACDWLQIGGDNAAIGGIIAVTWEVFGPLWHAMCHLWSAIFLIDDGITSSSRNTRAEDGARGWMWANDLVIDAPAWSVTHDTSDGRRLQSRRPAHQTSSAVRGNNRDGNKILSSSSSSSYRCCDSRQGHWVKVVCALPVNCPTRLQSRVHQRRQPITDHKQKHKQWLLENIEGGKRLEGQCRNLLCCANQKQQMSLNCNKLIASR